MRAGAHRAILLAAALSACAPAEERSAAVPANTATTTASLPDTAMTAAPSAADSVRGIVERAGSDPTTRLFVRGADGRICALEMDAPPPFEGLEMTLWGPRRNASTTMLPGVSCALTVERYSVRAVDGIAAVDGILRTDGTAYALETADGTRRPLGDVPSALRAQQGARIFWAGPLDRAPAAYGVLVPAR